MKGWLADLLRTIGAWWYWNARKTIYVARGRIGRCPCQNDSDIGGRQEARCEAVVFWRSPDRFRRRVCPLLKRTPEGDWVCSVPPERVRPFWGRVLASHGLAFAVIVLGTGGIVWVGMRAVGYHVSGRQIFWPPAWRELRQVRAELFREKAEAALRAGKPREALAALGVARQLRPYDYATGRLLAELLHIVQPEAADGTYQMLLAQHPEQASETARAWCRSLLARGRLAGAGRLALARLASEPAAAAAWTHVLVTAARWDRDWKLLAAVAEDARLPDEARAVCALELELRRADARRARAILRAQAASATPYAALHRAERLIEFGESLEALDLLQLERGRLAGRDVVRMTLAALAAGKSRAALEREAGLLLGADGANAVAGVTLVAQHLIRFPDDALLGRCREAFRRLPPGGAGREEAAAALYCAAALAGRIDWLGELRKQFAGSEDAGTVAPQRIEEKLRGKEWTPLFLLSVVRPVSTDLNYAVLERMLAGR